MLGRWHRMVAPRKDHLRGKMAKEGNPTCSWGFSKEAEDWERGEGGWSLHVGREIPEGLWLSYQTAERAEAPTSVLPGLRVPWLGLASSHGLEYLVLQHTQCVVTEKGPARAVAGRL